MAKNKMQAAKIKKLSRYLDAREEWEYWRDRLNDLKGYETKITPSMNGMPGGTPDGSKTEVLVEEYEEAREQEAATREAMNKAREYVAAAIQTVEVAAQRILLRRRYIDGMKWERLAEASGKSRQWATVTHGVALANIVLPDQEEVTEKNCSFYKNSK